MKMQGEKAKKKLKFENWTNTLFSACQKMCKKLT